MGSPNARFKLRQAGSATSSLYFPLRRLALCLDCDVCFELGSLTCPACGGGTWVLLARFLDHAPFRLLPQLHPLATSWTGGSKPPDDRERQVAQQVLVVARDRQKLYEYAKRAFSGNPTVQVIMDRRGAERRSNARPRVPERRRGDRRVAFDVDTQLRVLGWAIMRPDVVRTRRNAAR